MIPLPSTDPSDIANAARCFSSCVPGTMQSALRTYLLTQVANIATPPCITPASPVIAVLPGLTTNTSITVAWNFAGNQGSLVNGYEVFWGTASGVYTNNSGRLPPGPVNLIHSYIISGLTAGTAYFIAVVALTTIAGCQSANSNEVTATTTGAAPGNHLLTGLISYWKFDDDEGAGASAVDSIGANPLLLSANATCGNVNCAGGIINGACCLGLGSTSATHADNTDFSPIANTSLSFSFWVSSTAWAGGAGGPLLISKGNGAGSSYDFYLDVPAGNRLAWVLRDTSNVLFGDYLTAGTPTNNVFHHLVGVFDSTNKLINGYYDGALIFSEPTTTGSVHANAVNFQVGVGAGFASLANLKIDELAMYHKALTQADVTTLFNGGAAFPLSSFTA